MLTVGCSDGTDIVCLRQSRSVERVSARRIGIGLDCPIRLCGRMAIGKVQLPRRSENMTPSSDLGGHDAALEVVTPKVPQTGPGSGT